MARRKSPDQPKEIPVGDHWEEPAVKAAIAAAAPRVGRRMDALRGRLDAYDHALHMDQFYRALNDDYANPMTGLGDPLQDKSMAGSVLGPAFFVAFVTAIAAENRWRGSDLGGTIVEKIPEEMTREGFDVTVQPDDDADAEEPDDRDDADPGFFTAPSGGGDPTAAPGGPPAPSQPSAIPDVDTEATDISEAIEGVLDDIGAQDALFEALCYERAYGGGAILIGADDGQTDLTQPLDEKNIKSVSWLNSLTGGRDGECVAWSYYRDPGSPKYGKPEVYMVRNIGVPVTPNPAPGTTVKPPLEQIQGGGRYGYGELVFWIHESRLLVFGGQPVSRRALVQMRGWGDSIFTRVDRVLQQYSQTWAGIANVMQDFKQDVLGIDGLGQKVNSNAKAPGGGNAFVTRAKTIQLTRSIARMLLIDKDKESMQRLMASLTGVPEVLQQFCLRLAAAVDMPVALLFGQAPAGLNATGASDIRFFYDRVKAKQRRRLLPQVKRLIRLIMLAKEGPTDGVEYAKWSVNFRPLYQETETEKVANRKTQAETDVAYINAGVLSAAEVTASRFGGADYSTDTQLDLEGRQEQADKDEEDRKARMKAFAAKAQQPPTEPGKATPQAPGGSSVLPPTKDPLVSVRVTNAATDGRSRKRKPKRKR